MKKPKIIAVDFDGTLAISKFPDIGKPIQNTIALLKKEQKKGARLILWTCRANEHLAAAVEWCKQQGLHFEAVNENLPDIIAAFGSDTRKIFANVYIDDRGVNISELTECEYWCDLKGYEGIYRISNHGRIESIKRGKMLALPPNSDGYLTAHLCKNGKSETRFVHGLVARTFVFNPFDKPFVNHKDLNRTNNKASNLEWCTHQENCQHRSENSTWTKRVSVLGEIVTLSELAEITNVKRDTLKHQLARLGENAFVRKILADYSEKFQFFHRHETMQGSDLKIYRQIPIRR